MKQYDKETLQRREDIRAFLISFVDRGEKRTMVSFCKKYKIPSSQASFQVASGYIPICWVDRLLEKDTTGKTREDFYPFLFAPKK